MATEYARPTDTRAHTPIRPRAGRGTLPRIAGMAVAWRHAALGAVLLVAAALNLWGLDREGYANTYYAAAVKSMLTSWHNFFYVAYDSGGFVAVDKPPLGLWIQAASAKLFGFSGLSLLVPEALAGVLAVAVLYRLVARPFGSVAGLVAALALALTPVAVVTDRNNTIDSLLILTLLLGAWAASRAAATGRPRPLLLCALLVGLGFNIKMLQAYLVLPAFALLYLTGAPLRWPRKLGHLALASVVLLVVSLAWAVAVDLTPASARPYVNDSGTNSELSLILGYNGLGRVTTLLASHLGWLGRLIPLHLAVDLRIVPAFAPGIGNPGLARLLGQALGGQASWLLPLALLGLLVAATHTCRRWPLDRRGQALILWGGWLLAAGAFFSFARFFHFYYLIMLAPPVAALAGIGFTALWRDYRAALGGADSPLPAVWRGWALPLALLVTAAAQASIAAPYVASYPWLTPLVVGGCVLAAVALTLARLRLAVQLAPGVALAAGRRAASAATAVGVLSLLAAPATWAAVTVGHNNGAATLPQAGPSASFFGGPGTGGPGPGGPGNGGPGGQRPSFGAGQAGGAGQPGVQPMTGRQPGAAGASAGPGGGGPGGLGGGSRASSLDQGLARYLEAHQGTARYLVATPSSTSYGDAFILATGRAVMTLGGYQGWDRILTPTGLARLVANGTVRYFYLPTSSNAGGFGPGGQGGPGGASTVASSLARTNDDLTTWVQQRCTVVPTTAWQTSTTTTGSGTGDAQLYDCAAASRP